MPYISTGHFSTNSLSSESERIITQVEVGVLSPAGIHLPIPHFKEDESITNESENKPQVDILVETTREIKDIAYLSSTSRKKELQIMKSLLGPSILPLFMSSPSSISEFSSIISPKPMYSYSPTDKSKSINEFKLSKVIEELIDSEEIYVNALRMLQNFYMDPILLKVEFEVAIPLRFLSFYLIIMISNHCGFLSSLKQVSSENHEQEDLAAKIATQIGENAIDICLYKQYCKVYEDVMKIIKSNKPFHIQHDWFGGWEKFLESTQPISKHMDFSFMSLIQRPTSRLGKYRLILESIAKYTSEDKQEGIHKSLNKLRNSLFLINDYAREYKESERSKLINDFIDFGAIPYETSLSLEFFGNCLLVGTIFIIWIEEDCCVLAQCGAFLYKSHFVLVDLEKRKPVKYIPTFVIPLSKSNILKDKKDIEGGLYSTYSNLIKILFESEDCQFEILCIFLSSKECSIWREELSTMIDFVNGSYAMDYSSNDRIPVIQYPQHLDPYDISLLSYANYVKYRAKCYFKRSKSVRICINFQSVLEEKDYSILEQENVQEIRRNERMAAEVLLCLLWSPELPKIFGQTRQHLRKSASWNSIKLGSFKSLRQTRSFRDIRAEIRQEHIEKDEPMVYDIERTQSRTSKFRNVMRGLFQTK